MGRLSEAMIEEYEGQVPGASSSLCLPPPYPPSAPEFRKQLIVKTLFLTIP